MGQLRFMALRAVGEGWETQSVVCTTLISSHFGVTMFWIRHVCYPNVCFKCCSATKRASDRAAEHPHWVLFKSWPQTAHSP